ncbi:hypothetical protein GCM10022402_32020 [Salinactinospora qingdaonensis]|uniref:MYXO-CTERM domain-containing protein n=1 Tax=Salinactinospora qingdaonensis TaxID=702744 RepID=A0ABP7FWW8_9ACTN
MPVVNGDTWEGDPRQLVSAVHDRLGISEGHYLALRGSNLQGVDVPLSGSDAGVSASAGALAAAYETDFASVPLADLLNRAVEVTVSGRAAELADQAEADYQARNPDPPAEDTGEGATPSTAERNASDLAMVAAIAAGVAVLAAAGMGLLLWRRRPRRINLPDLPQHAAFDNADQARVAELTSQAERELVTVGERLREARTEDMRGQAGKSYQRALDAYQAAGKAFSEISDAQNEQADQNDLANLAGTLVLLDMCEDCLATAEARRDGRSLPKPRAHCYANPLHGTRTKPTEWRALGSRRTITVPLCGACADAVRRHARPTALPVVHDGEEIAYYEVPAQHSVWSDTGFGALRGDLIERVLRGDLRHSRV